MTTATISAAISGTSDCGTAAAATIAVSALQNGSSGWMKSGWWLNE